MSHSQSPPEYCKLLIKHSYTSKDSSLKIRSLVTSCHLKPDFLSSVLWNTKWQLYTGYVLPCNYNEWGQELASFKRDAKHNESTVFNVNYLDVYNWKLKCTNVNPLFLVATVYKQMPFCCDRIQKSPYLNLRGANIETDLHFLFQTIWLALKKNQSNLHPMFTFPQTPLKVHDTNTQTYRTWVTRTNFRIKWIWMLPHQRQLVKKAPQMVRDEWTKAHFIGSQKNKMAKCVFESLVGLCCMDNMTNASCRVWDHHSGFGQLLVQFMIFLRQWRPVFWITRLECSWTSNNLFEWSIKPNPTRKAQS